MSTIWANITKNAASWSNAVKNAATWANQAKNSLISFLLKEDAFFLLLETGDKIILNDVEGWTNQIKN